VLVGWDRRRREGQPVPCDWEFKKLLDVPRRIALLDEAGLNDLAAAEDARDESFRRLQRSLSSGVTKRQARLAA
jgi:hypothetical protein